MSHLFWSFYRRFVQPDLPEGGFDIFGCNRLFRDHLLNLRESHNVLIGQLFWLGFRREIIPYTRRPNPRGKSTWTFARKVRYAMDNLFLFSDFPVKGMLLLGSLGMVLTVAFIPVVLLLHGEFFRALPGRAMWFLFALALGSIQLLGFGILGAYLWRILENTRQWPPAIIMDQQTFPINKGENGIQTP
jgi:hypothetical protein